jgi:uncharacterized protein
VRLRPARRNGELLGLFAEAGGNAARAAEMLASLLSSWPDDHGLGRQILICEQDGDRITHDIIHLLNRSLAGRLDRSDGLALTSAVDDVVDFTEEAADYLQLYRIEAPLDQAQRLADTLRDAARSLDAGLRELGRPELMSPHIVEVNRLENEGDQILREGLASLFDGGIDPMVVIRWKDVLERIEEALDACETAAHVLEGIAIKAA